MIKFKLTFYDNHIIKTSTEYVNDEITTYIEYDPLGQITHKRTPSTIENYINSKPHGELIVYHDNGKNIHLYKTYNNGILINDKIYSLNGNLRFDKIYFPNGKQKHGKSYFPNDNLSNQLQFEVIHNDEKDISIRIDYYFNGNIREISNFISDKELTGTNITFHENGNIHQCCEMKNYDREGPTKIYHKNGIIFMKTNYIKNKIIQNDSVFFNEKGKKLNDVKDEKYINEKFIELYYNK